MASARECVRTEGSQAPGLRSQREKPTGGVVAGQPWCHTDRHSVRHAARAGESEGLEFAQRTALRRKGAEGRDVVDLVGAWE